jgi:hypothetical protein
MEKLSKRQTHADSSDRKNKKITFLSRKLLLLFIGNDAETSKAKFSVGILPFYFRSVY